MKKSKKKTTSTSTTTTTTIESSSNNEVEQLLQAAHDEMLLKLSVDSHMSRVAPDYIHSDLDRRFQALKSRPSKAIKPAKQQQQQQQQKNNNVVVVVDEELKGVLGDDDLATRFAALKASCSSSSSNNQLHVGPNISDAQHQNHDDAEEEDEVEKLIKWAIDAARLDPSPPSDDDDDDTDKDSDDHQVIHRQKENPK